MWPFWGKPSKPPEEAKPVEPSGPAPTMYRGMYPWDLAALKSLHSKLFSFDYDIGSFIIALQSERFVSIAAYPEPTPEILLGSVITTAGPMGAFLDMTCDSTSNSSPTESQPATPTPEPLPLSPLSPQPDQTPPPSTESSKSPELVSAYEQLPPGPAVENETLPPASSLPTTSSTSAQQNETLPPASSLPTTSSTSAQQSNHTHDTHDTQTKQETHASASPLSLGGQRADSAGAGPNGSERAAVEDARPLEYLKLAQYLSQQPEAICIYICWLGVAPPAQGRGIGATLLQHAFTCAKSARAEHVLLHVQADNLSAQRFYTRHGFRVLCTVPGFYELSDTTNTTVDALLMYRNLADEGFRALDALLGEQDVAVSAMAGDGGVVERADVKAATSGAAVDPSVAVVDASAGEGGIAFSTVADTRSVGEQANVQAATSAGGFDLGVRTLNAHPGEEDVSFSTLNANLGEEDVTFSVVAGNRGVGEQVDVQAATSVGRCKVHVSTLDSSLVEEDITFCTLAHSRSVVEQADVQAGPSVGVLYPGLNEEQHQLSLSTFTSAAGGVGANHDLVAQSTPCTVDSRTPLAATVPPTPSTSHAAPATVPPTPSTSHAAPATVPPTPSTSHAAPTTVPPTLSTSHAAPATVPPTPSTSHAAPATVPPTSSTSHAAREASCNSGHEINRTGALQTAAHIMMQGSHDVRQLASSVREYEPVYDMRGGGHTSHAACFASGSVSSFAVPQSCILPATADRYHCERSVRRNGLGEPALHLRGLTFQATRRSRQHGGVRGVACSFGNTHNMVHVQRARLSSHGAYGTLQRWHCLHVDGGSTAAVKARHTRALVSSNALCGVGAEKLVVRSHTQAVGQLAAARVTRWQHDRYSTCRAAMMQHFASGGSLVGGGAPGRLLPARVPYRR